MNTAATRQHAATSLGAWLFMCATNEEFVHHYNRLRGARISFKVPKRTPFEALIDAATGHVPTPRNDPRELAAFSLFCIDMFSRIPAPEPSQ